MLHHQGGEGIKTSEGCKDIETTFKKRANS